MVQRYQATVVKSKYEDNRVDILPNSNGFYVKFEVYQTLASEYDALQDKYDRLVKKLGDIYGDA